MAALGPMPALSIGARELATFGQQWLANGNKLSRSGDQSASRLGLLFDRAVGNALSAMLGNIPVVTPNGNKLLPEQSDCVEVGPVRVVGGVRPQNFDVGYRPDGLRFAFDSKTLNDTKSVGKNWQNMINDLATEATTVHSRFPSALVGFICVIPEPCLPPGRRQMAMIETLERMTGRSGINDPDFTAEAISLVLWDPHTGSILTNVPAPSSPLRLERFSEAIERAYVSRFKGLPPHAVDGDGVDDRTESYDAS